VPETFFREIFKEISFAKYPAFFKPTLAGNKTFFARSAQKKTYHMI
jgi:hypothetical protein